MTNFASSDESFARLHAAGWSVAEVRLAEGQWLVTGSNGEPAGSQRRESGGSLVAGVWASGSRGRAGAPVREQLVGTKTVERHSFVT